MSDFVENVVLSLEKYEKMKTQIAELKTQIEELTKVNLENEKLLTKFYKPFVENQTTKEQFKEIVKQLENANFTVTTLEDVKRQKIKVMLELDKYLE